MIYSKKWGVVMYDVLNGTFEDAYHDCMIVANSIVDDKSFQEADTGLILGYLDRITEALEKQIAKKPLGGTDIEGNLYKICPYCSAIVEDGEWRATYCPDCGQKLDFTEV